MTVTRDEIEVKEDVVNRVEISSTDPSTSAKAEKRIKYREKNQTLELFSLLGNVKCIGVKWIYKKVERAWRHYQT